MLLASCFLLVLLCLTCQINGHGRQAGFRIKFCGDDFYKMYEYCCKHGCANGKREIDFSEGYKETNGKGFNLILKRKAISFLKYRKRSYGKDFQRSKRNFITDNAYEECCVEGCTIEEVREYPCY